jgi:hypothetical protein
MRKSIYNTIIDIFKNFNYLNISELEKILANLLGENEKDEVNNYKYR